MIESSEIEVLNAMNWYFTLSCYRIETESRKWVKKLAVVDMVSRQASQGDDGAGKLLWVIDPPYAAT